MTMGFFPQTKTTKLLSSFKSSKVACLKWLSTLMLPSSSCSHPPVRSNHAFMGPGTL